MPVVFNSPQSNDRATPPDTEVEITSIRAIKIDDQPYFKGRLRAMSEVLRLLYDADMVREEIDGFCMKDAGLR